MLLDAAKWNFAVKQHGAPVDLKFRPTKRGATSGAEGVTEDPQRPGRWHVRSPRGAPGGQAHIATCDTLEEAAVLYALAANEADACASKKQKTSPPGDSGACPTSVSEPQSISPPQDGRSLDEGSDLNDFDGGGSEPPSTDEPQAQPPSTDEIENLVPPRTSEPADSSPPQIVEVETPPTHGAALELAGPPRASSGPSALRLGGLVAPVLGVLARPEAPRRASVVELPPPPFQVTQM